MKKFLSTFTLCTFFCISNLFANDTYFYMSGGALTPTNKTDTEIQMVEEVIELTMYDKYYETTVDFNFYNYGDEKEIAVGFPFFMEGVAGKGKIYDFKCWTDGVPTDYTEKPLEHEWQKATGLEYAYVRNVKFKSKATTKTKVYYKSNYGRSAPSYDIATYLYGTGSTWKDSIGKITLRIKNNMKYDRPIELRNGATDPSVLYNNSTGADISQNFKMISDGVYEATFENVEPSDYTDIFFIMMGDILDDTGPKGFPAYFNYDKYKVSDSKLFWFRKDQLRLVRNTIYALHGYIFKSADLRVFFSAEWNSYWYKPNPNFSEDDLNEIEKYNINKILEEENRRK